MLEIGIPVSRSSPSILGEIDAFASIWVKPSSLAFATNWAMWLNLPLTHMVDREIFGNLPPFSTVVSSNNRATIQWIRLQTALFEVSVSGT